MLVLALAIEMLLQLGEILATRRHPLAPGRCGPVRAGVVLCVGDGTVFGPGVPRELGWPARLPGERPAATREVHLAAHLRQHTRDALRDLPQWLAERRPARVLVCLGADDAIVAPTPWYPAQRETVYGRRPRFELPYWLGLPDPDASRRPEVDAGALLGTWYAAGLAIRFDRDGTVRIADRDARWLALDDRHLELTPAGGQRVDVRFAMEGPTLVLDSPVIGGAVPFERQPLDAAPDGRLRGLLMLGRVLEAKLVLDGLVADGAPAELVARLRSDFDAVVGGRPDATLPPPFDVPAGLPDDRELGELTRDLTTAIEVCRCYGAEPIVVGHAAARFAAIDAAQSSAAATAGARYVEVAAELSRAAGDPALTTAAGFLTSPGHAAVAALVARALATTAARYSNGTDTNR
ncbi:MAG: hypothetical protein IPM29_08920 [Planctomycetes bacterium]|nr:hypothetical protein [Planctomycetota bacterium]